MGKKKDTTLDDLASQSPIEKGNIDLNKRPKIKNTRENKDGYSTVLSASFNIDGKEVLLPTVSDDGEFLNDAEAVALYKKTGKHLGKFATPAQANAYAELLHKKQEQQYKNKSFTK